MCAFFLPGIGRYADRLRNRYFSASPWEWPAYLFNELANSRSLSFMISSVGTGIAARCRYIKVCMRIYGASVERLGVLAHSGHKNLAFDKNDRYTDFVQRELDLTTPNLKGCLFGSDMPERGKLPYSPARYADARKGAGRFFAYWVYRHPSRKCHASYDAYRFNSATFRRNMSSIQAV